MEKVSNNKSQSQYLTLLVKKISQDRLTNKESDLYVNLKKSIDPLGNLEEELTIAWRMAEGMHIVESIYSAWSVKGKENFSFKNLFKTK